MIFVFGSNRLGIHGAGAAKYAAKNHGAIRGIGEGQMGSAYALPTKFTPHLSMTLIEIHGAVLRFLRYAASRPDLKFKITQVGCGLGGYTKEEIAPLFTTDPGPTSNCYFDEAWREFLPSNMKFWGSI